MRAAELFEPRQFRVAERVIEEPGPGEVQVRVAAVGICGSDLHYFSEGGIAGSVCVYPVVLGHEPTGIVVKTGRGVSGWSAGDRACLEPAIYCYECEFCRSGRHNLCAKGRFLSSRGEPGFFREYVNLPVANLLPIPQELSLDEATLFEPAAVALHSLTFAALRPGERVAVFGAGPVGLLTIAMLKLSGAGRIWAVEPVAARRELALQMGADAAISSVDADPAREILHETGGRGVDAAFDCAARGDSMNQAIWAVRRAGRVVLVGISSELQAPLDVHAMRNKEVTLYSAFRSNHESETALELLWDHREFFRPLLTHTFPLEGTQRAFTLLDGYEDGVGKVLIQP